jgi:predicted DNA-binding antitoxin AbrB/MazE fold protein
VNYKEQFICLGLSEELQKHWKEAAEYYVSKHTNEIESQARCLWEGGFLKELQMVKLRSEKQIVRLAIANLMLTGSINQKMLEELYQYKHILRQIIEKITWRSELISRLIEFSESLNSDQIRYVCDILEEIALSSEENIYKTLGYLYAKVDNFDKDTAKFVPNNLEIYMHYLFHIKLS